MGPEHLSAYALTLDKESLAEEVPLARQLARGEVSLPPDEEVIAMAQVVRETYAGAGLERYEISNYARPGHHSRHNSLYWTGGEYLAIGVGATGRLGRVPEASRELLDGLELFEERIAMGLRLSSGVDVAAVCRAFGQPYGGRSEEIGRLVANGLAREEGGRLALTSRGMNLHSAISARLM